MDQEIIEEFVTESQGLIDELKSLLEEADGNPSLAGHLEQYGQRVDRIMGSAQSLAQTFAEGWDGAPLLNQMGDYAAICKSVGYKASQIRDNEHFFNVCVAFLIDSTDLLEKLLLRIKKNEITTVGEILTKTLIDRLRWINEQFRENVRATVGSTSAETNAKLSRNEIDDLLKKLGLP